MNYRIKICTSEDIDLLTEMRMRFQDDINKNKNIDPDEMQKAITRAEIKKYFSDMMRDNSYIGYLGYIEEKIITTSGLLIYKLPPLNNLINRLQGHLLNVYTEPDFRGKGYGDRMIKFVIDDARARGIFRIFLNATKMGEKLYRKNGFHEQNELGLVKEL